MKIDLPRKERPIIKQVKNFGSGGSHIVLPRRFLGQLVEIRLLKADQPAQQAKIVPTANNSSEIAAEPVILS